MGDKTKAHIRYKNAAGQVVPGVTTALGILNKPALVKWANNLGLKGIDSSKYVDDKAQIGSLAHEMIACHFKGTKADTSDYSPNQVEAAENCLLKFWDYESQHKIEPIIVEEPLISERHQYGGTVDLYAKLDGKPALVDFKSGAHVYPEYFAQLAAYKQLLLEAGHEVTTARILRIGRDATEGFEERVATNLDHHWLIFYHCLQIYNLKKEG